MSPSDASWQQLISALHASGRKAALAITGAAAGRLASCFEFPEVTVTAYLTVERRDDASEIA
jgi:hypothetical protein